VSATRAPGKVQLKLAGGKDDTHFAIWSRHAGEWRFAVAPASKSEWTVVGEPSAVVVSAIDRVGNESARVSVLKPADAALAGAK
jgi:hypothetical protein